MSEHFHAQPGLPLSARPTSHWPSRLIALAIAVAGLATASAGAAPPNGKDGGGHQSPPPPLPSVTITPASVNFGGVENGLVATQSVTVTNTGNAAATVFYGIPSGFASMLPSCNIASNGALTLAAGASCTIPLIFAPIYGAVGTSTSTFEVFIFNDPTNFLAGSTVLATVPVTATGLTSGLFVGSVTSSGAPTVTVEGGQSFTVTVNLVSTPPPESGGPPPVPGCVPAPFDVPVTVGASVYVNGVNVAHSPSSVIVPGGQCQASFTVTTDPVSSAGSGMATGYTVDNAQGPLYAENMTINVTP